MDPWENAGLYYYINEEPIRAMVVKKDLAKSSVELAASS